MDQNQDKQRTRSISFPTIGLEKALDKALIVYEKERRHEVLVDVVAQHLGYKNTRNGPAGRLLSTLKQFGLCERPKEGYLSVTKDFELYHLETDPVKKNDLIQKFMKSPPAFETLFKRFGVDFPSDASLKQFLILEAGVINSSVDEFIRSFRETLDFSKFNNLDLHNIQPVVAKIENISSEKNPENLPPAVLETKNSFYSNLQNSPGHDRVPVRLGGGRRAWIEIPLQFYKSDREIIKAYLDSIFTEDGESP